MSPISRGFGLRRRRDVDPSRLPPGQYLVNDFPVLSAGPTPHHPLDEWSFTIHGAVDEPMSWPWADFLSLPSESITVDIHCVTKWSKLDTSWRGVSLDTLFEGVTTKADYVTAWSDGGYTTNLPLKDLLGGRAWVAYEYGGEPLEPEHGGPARLLVPHLYFWKSAKWLRGLTLTRRGRARLLGGRRLPQLRRSMAGAAVLERLTVARSFRSCGVWLRVRHAAEETSSAKTIVLDVPGWPGHVAGQHVDVRLTAEDGYQAERSYSIASAPEAHELSLTVERIDDGEVSPYLTEELRAGDELELRGPVGGHFTWRVGRRRPVTAARRRLGLGAADVDAAPPRRTAEPARRGGCWSHRAASRTSSTATSSRRLRRRRSRAASHADATGTAGGWAGFSRRVDREMLAEVGSGRLGAAADLRMRPTGFVERAADLLVELGHDPATIRAERFGPDGRMR